MENLGIYVPAGLVVPTSLAMLLLGSQDFTLAADIRPISIAAIANCSLTPHSVHQLYHKRPSTVGSLPCSPSPPLFNTLGAKSKTCSEYLAPIVRHVANCSASETIFSKCICSLPGARLISHAKGRNGDPVLMVC